MRLLRIFRLDGHTKDVSNSRAVIQHVHGHRLPMKVIKPNQAARHVYDPIDFMQSLYTDLRKNIGKSSRNDLWA